MAEEVESTSNYLMRLTLLTLGLGVGGFFVSFIAGMAALLVSAQMGSDADATLRSAIWFRTLGALFLLVFIAWRQGNKWRPTNLAPYVAVAVIGYAINPMTWDGKALFAELFTENVLLAIVLDGALWILTFVGVLWSRANQRVPVPSRTPR